MIIKRMIRISPNRRIQRIGFWTFNAVVGFNLIIFGHGVVKADATPDAQQMLNQNAVSTRSLDLTQKTNSIMPVAFSSITHSGVSGTASWDIDSTGKLTIHAGQLALGVGNWSPYASLITSVYVEEGVKPYSVSGEANGSGRNPVFSSLPNVINIDVSNLDVTGTISLGGFFADDPKLTQIVGLENWDTSYCVMMTDMFANDKALATVDVSKFDTSVVTSMSGMFQGCAALTSLDVSNFNTPRLDNISSMFKGIKGKINGLANLNVSSATSMRETFYVTDFTLNDPDDIKDWNTSRVTSFFGSFRECKFSTLDLSKWDFGRVTDMAQMFQGDSNIDQVKGLANWDVSNVTNMSYMFNTCSNLEALDLSKWNTKSLKSTTGMFSKDSLLNENNLKGYDTLDISKVITMGYMFQNTGFTFLDLSQYDTSNVKDMTGLFATTTKLQKIIGNFNTDQVTDMINLFGSSNVSDLSELNIADWNLSKVTSLASVFSIAKKIEDFSFLKNWDVSSVKSLQRTFYGVTSEQIPVENWDVSKVSDFENTFFGTSALTNLPIENWDVSSGTKFSGTFWASGLKTIDLSKWNTSNATSFYAMFNSMSNLESLDLSNLDMTNATDVQYMFGGDKNLWKITLGPKNIIKIAGNTEGSRLLTPVAGTPIQDSNTTESYKAISDRWQEVDPDSGGTDHAPVGDLVSTDDILNKFATTGNSVTTYVWQQQPKVDLQMSVPDLDFGTTSNASGIVSRKTKDFAVTINNKNYPEEAFDAKLSVALVKPLTDSFDSSKTLSNVLIFRNAQNADNVLSNSPTEVYSGPINFGTNQLSWDDKHGFLLNMNNDRQAQNGHYSGTLEWELTNSI